MVNNILTTLELAFHLIKSSFDFYENLKQKEGKSIDILKEIWISRRLTELDYDWSHAGVSKVRLGTDTKLDSFEWWMFSNCFIVLFLNIGRCPRSGWVFLISKMEKCFILFVMISASAYTSEFLLAITLFLLCLKVCLMCISFMRHYVGLTGSCYCSEMKGNWQALVSNGETLMTWKG